MSNIENEINQIISANPKSPLIRDLNPYLITQSELSKEDIPKDNLFCHNGCQRIALEWFMLKGVLENHGFAWQWQLQ